MPSAAKGDVVLTNDTQRHTYLVVGLGRFGTSLCERLNEMGAHVIAVDKVRARVEELSDRLVADRKSVV